MIKMLSNSRRMRRSVIILASFVQQYALFDVQSVYGTPDVPDDVRECVA